MLHAQELCALNCTELLGRRAELTQWVVAGVCALLDLLLCRVSHILPNLEDAQGHAQALHATAVSLFPQHSLQSGWSQVCVRC
jgi:hypothetical protein